MNQALTLSIFGLLSVFVTDQAISEPLHPDIVVALEWQAVDHECKAPRQRAFTFSIDIEKYHDDADTWLKCLHDHGQGLVTDIDRLKNSAQHGLTQSQATTILGNMATAQTALETLAEQVKIELRRFPTWSSRDLDNYFRNGI